MSRENEIEDVRKLHNERFSVELDRIIRYAEEFRLKKSRELDDRNRAAVPLGIASFTLVVTCFLWILMFTNMDTIYAWATLLVLFLIPVPLNSWTNRPVKEYRLGFKYDFMPRLAKLMGKMQFHPSGGISVQSVKSSGVIPPFDKYVAEDAFVGKFKGTKIIISEAKLFSNKSSDPFFRGVFVLLFAPKNKFRGHTIITRDDKMVRAFRNGRWKKLQDVPFKEGVKQEDFMMFSTLPEEAKRFADRDMMENMQKIADIFEDSRISAVFYGKNRVFLSIPNDEDMFEPGDIYVPVTRKEHVMRHKQEIEKLLSIVDVLEVYDAEEENLSEDFEEATDFSKDH